MYIRTDKQKYVEDLATTARKAVREKNTKNYITQQESSWEI